MNRKRLSERERTILALLKVYGEAPTSNLKQIIYPGQPAYLGRQEQYLLRTLHRLEKRGLIKRDSTGMLWEVTDAGKDALGGKN